MALSHRLSHHDIYQPVIMAIEHNSKQQKTISPLFMNMIRYCEDRGINWPSFNDMAQSTEYASGKDFSDFSQGLTAINVHW